MANKVNTIIVGGGVGGTALGALLASGGQKVILLEKNSIIGGRCTSYIKNDFLVDVGVHLFGIGDKGPLGEVCRRAGKPDAIEWVLAKNPRVSMHYQGKTQGFSREMMMGNVEKKELGNLANLLVKLMQITDEELDKLWYTSLLDFLSEFTTEKNIHSMFSMLCGIYFCIPPDVTSAAEFIKTFRELTQAKSSGYPKGGCIAIPKAYQKIIEAHGGEVRLDCPVDKIIIEDGKALGVIAGGDTIYADRVVSNADIKTTIGTMAAAEHFPNDYVKRIQDLTFTSHVVSLKVALNEKITDEKMIMYAPNMSDDELQKLAKQYLDGEEIPMIPAGMLNVPTNFDPNLAPDGKQMIFFGTKCERHQDWDKWGDICMEALKEVFPGIEKHVLWTTIDSPDTVDYYAGENGNIIGVGQTIDQIHERRPTHETPVEGLYLCGAEAGGHGIGTELAASSAIELADKLLNL